MEERIVKVKRIIEYEGPESWVDLCLEKSITKPENCKHVFGEGKVIRELFVGKKEEVKKEVKYADCQQSSKPDSGSASREVSK